jgi:hypothetical protein
MDRIRLLQHDLLIVEAHLLLPERLRNRLPAIDRGWKGFGLDETEASPSAATLAQQRQQLLSQTLTRLQETDTQATFNSIRDAIQTAGRKPGFYFVHADVPHAPWQFLPDGRQYAIRRNPFPGLTYELWTGSAAVVDEAFQRHLLQTQYADRLGGEILDRLRSAGLYERALVVVAADHGISFRAGEPRRGANETNMPNIANVPLLIKAPSQERGVVDDAAVRTLDIVPTMARLLGGRLPWDMDGIPPPAETRTPPLRSGSPTRDFHPHDAPLRTDHRIRDARERREQRMLGPSRDVYGIGSLMPLVGRRPSALDLLPAVADEGVRLDGAADYANVAPDTRVVPAYVSGAVTGLAAGDEVAVAIDGRIQATTRVRPEGEELVFAALVPPTTLAPGSHAVAIYRVVDPARLRELRQEAA